MSTPGQVLVWVAFASGVIAGCVQTLRNRSPLTVVLTCSVVAVFVYLVGFLLLS